MIDLNMFMIMDLNLVLSCVNTNIWYWNTFVSSVSKMSQNENNSLCVALWGQEKENLQAYCPFYVGLPFQNEHFYLSLMLFILHH